MSLIVLTPLTSGDRRRGCGGGASVDSAAPDDTTSSFTSPRDINPAAAGSGLVGSRRHADTSKVRCPSGAPKAPIGLPPPAPARARGGNFPPPASRCWLSARSHRPRADPHRRKESVRPHAHALFGASGGRPRRWGVAAAPLSAGLATGARPPRLRGASITALLGTLLGTFHRCAGTSLQGG